MSVWLLSHTGPAYAGPLTVDSWVLGVSIQSSNTTSTGSATVSNPYIATHHRTLGNDWVTANYDFSWAEQGRFLVNSSLAATATSLQSTLSGISGRIKITPSEDILVTYHAVFDVTLPADPMTAQLNAGILDVSTGEQIMDITESHSTLFGTGFRHLEDSGEVVVPANRTWDFTYSFDIYPHWWSAGNQGSGTGYIEFLIIPEPATLGLLLVAGYALIRRARQN